jgi:hypothetical protein
MHFSTFPQYKENQVGQMECKRKNQGKADTGALKALCESCFLFKLYF